MVRAVLHKIYDFLSPDGSAEKADCIFVLAGRQERKVFAIDLWRQGLAPELILSVGRFEWRRFYTLGLPDDGGLRQQVEQTLPVRRHFFVSLTAETAACRLVEKGKFGTQTEALALARMLGQRQLSKVLVVSDAIHLRRVSFIFRRTFRNVPVALCFLGLPEQFSPVQRADWWKTKQGRVAVLKELWKFLCYRLIF